MNTKINEFASRMFNNGILNATIKFIAIFYFSILFYIFFLARRRRGPMLPWHKRNVNLIPLKNKIDFLAGNPYVAYSSGQEFYKDLFGNIILFIPFAFFLVIVFHIASAGRIVLIALLTSVSIELIQFLLSIGVADIDDIILNITGAGIGTLILKILKKLKVPPRNFQL